jgi:two-component system nitrogen regulation sensor histidine kinase NtrY
LLGLILLALLTLIGRAWPPGTQQRLVPWLRGSFYRKLLAALLVASVLPLVGLALFLRGYLERLGDAALIASATQFVSTAQRVIEDYTADVVEGEVELNDDILHWLRRIVGQEIHVYRDARLQASSTPELFDSGLLPLRLDGEVQHRLVEEGLPYLVAPMSIGRGEVPVAYAPVRELGGEPLGRLVVAVPLVLEQRQIARALSRVAEMILLATVALVGLLAVVAAGLARTVARPVRELVEATGQIAAGDYGTRLEPRTEDEVAELVHGFNTMAAALARQRADIERRRDYIETLLRHATIGVISLDSRGCIVTLNPAAGELLASAAGRLEVGAELGRALAGSQEFEPLARALSAAQSGVPVDVDLVRDPEPRRFRGVRVELSKADGESFGTLILLEDVTEQMRANQLAAWAEMARSIAHEIKNPLTPIQLSAEHLARLLSDRAEGATPDEQACLETIVKQVRALYDIAGEFSAYAKLPVLTPEPTDPVEFMRGVIDPYRASKPPGVAIEEHYEPAPAIAADAKVLSRAVINLIENALQAMTEGGTLTVGVAAVDPNGTVELSVADTGHGLSREVRRRLFEPYFSTKSSGSGLGLAIARKAVEAHGGEIEVVSAPDRGAIFRIRIPTDKP